MTTLANIRCQDCGWYSREGEDHVCQYPPLWHEGVDPTLHQLERALQWGLDHTAQDHTPITGGLLMACPHCGSDADWYTLADGRGRCPGCYATSDPKGAEQDMKDQLDQRDSTDKGTTTPTRIDPDVAKQQAKDTK